MAKLIVLTVFFGLAIGASFGVACLLAWAITSIWPSVPFWPAAIGMWAMAGLFSKTSFN